MFLSNRDKVFLFVCILFSLPVLGALLGILYYLVKESLPILQEFGLFAFFSGEGWYPSEELWNLKPMILGSLAVMAGSVLWSLPVAFGVACFLVFSSWYSVVKFLRSVLLALASVPSVIFGFWGLVVLVPLIVKVANPGTSLMAGIIVLGFMLLPLMSLQIEELLKSQPKDLFLASEALGFNRYTYIVKVIRSHLKGALFSIVLLQCARALGETMAVMMVTGNVVQMPGSAFDSVRALTSNIALELGYAMPIHRSGLFVSGLLLCLVVTALTLMGNRGRT